MPVGTAFSPAAAARRITSSGTAVVAMSMSLERQPHQRVARRAADHARLLAVAVEHRERARQRRRVEPAPRPAAGPLRHFSAPGTSRPFSMWAGT